VGFDPRTEGFLWFAGQGGYGFQLAAALARAGAAIASGAPLEPSLEQHGITVNSLGPARLLG
jgi:D-arginine dehydrogenase